MRKFGPKIFWPRVLVWSGPNYDDAHCMKICPIARNLGFCVQGKAQKVGQFKYTWYYKWIFT